MKELETKTNKDVVEFIKWQSEQRNQETKLILKWFTGIILLGIMFFILMWLTGNTPPHIIQETCTSIKAATGVFL